MEFKIGDSVKFKSVKKFKKEVTWNYNSADVEKQIGNQNKIFKIINKKYDTGNDLQFTLLPDINGDCLWVNT